MILSGSYVTKRSIGRWKMFYQEIIYRACTLYFIIMTVRRAMLDIAEYKMMNREGWLELYQTYTRSNTIKTVIIYLFIYLSSSKDKKQVLTPMARAEEVSSAVSSIRYILYIV